MAAALCTVREESLDRQQSAAQVGWLEVLMAREGHAPSTLPPGPMMLIENNKKTVWTQQRRLILPRTATAGMALHTVLPLQIDGDTYSSLYHVWTRLVVSSGDRTTPWQQTDLASLVIAH
jgi:hypothetical protein